GGCGGRVEFLPEEGKSHREGHGKCNMRLTPRETIAGGGGGPGAGGPVTIGVEPRVEALADRHDERVAPPATAGAVANLVPLPEVLSEITASGPSSKTVQHSYDKVIGTLGPELFVLQQAPVEDVARAASPLLAEALTRLRRGPAIREARDDGEDGVVPPFRGPALARVPGRRPAFGAPRGRAEKSA